MSATPVGISEADWQAAPIALRPYILDQQAQQQEIEQRGRFSGTSQGLSIADKMVKIRCAARDLCQRLGACRA